MAPHLKQMRNRSDYFCVKRSFDSSPGHGRFRVSSTSFSFRRHSRVSSIRMLILSMWQDISKKVGSFDTVSYFHSNTDPFMFLGMSRKVRLRRGRACTQYWVLQNLSQDRPFDSGTGRELFHGFFLFSFGQDSCSAWFPICMLWVVQHPCFHSAPPFPLIPCSVHLASQYLICSSSGRWNVVLTWMTAEFYSGAHCYGSVRACTRC